MPTSFLVLVGCQLIGEVLRRALHLPLPGPVIGMLLLATVLAIAGNGSIEETSKLAQTANALIVNMGLLFVPAGVGVIVEFRVLQQNWLPILAGLLLSTIFGLVVTGLVMHHVNRIVESGRRQLPLLASQQETP